MITAPQECPLKYMKTTKKGGILEHQGQIHDYCYTAPLPYGSCTPSISSTDCKIYFKILMACGNKKLYSMGLDGACIGTLMKLSPEQIKELVEELDTIRERNNKKKEKYDEVP